MFILTGVEILFCLVGFLWRSIFLLVSGWWEVSGFTLEVVVGTEGGGVGLFEGSRLCRFLLFYNPQTPFEGGFGRWRSYVPMFLWLLVFLWVSGWWEGCGFTFKEVVGTEGVVLDF